MFTRNKPYMLRHPRGPCCVSRTSCLVLGLLLQATAAASDGLSFRDDFTSPGSPVTWRQLLGDEMTIADGQLVFGVSGYLAGVAVNEFTASNLAVEAQFQILSGSQGGVFLRDDGTGFVHYFGNLRTSTHINYPGRADIWRSDSRSSSTPLTPFTEVDFDPDGVVVMRLQAIDDNLSVWVWPGDTDRPPEPFLTAQDATFTDGEVGLFVVDYPQSQRALMAVDYFEVTVFPDGDFDYDGDVDGTDFLLWQRGESPDPLSASDLADWQMNYCFGSEQLSFGGAIPEPGSLFLGGLCCAALLYSHRNRARRKYILSVMFVAAVVCSTTNTPAATIFFDDFEDGDHLDGSPVTWGFTGPDVDDEEMVIDGSLVLTSSGINLGYNLAGVEIELQDVSIRTQARAGEADDVLSAGVRVVGVYGGYYIRVGPYQDWPTQVLGLAGLEGGDRILAPTDLEPFQEDVVMQIDAIGDQISVWAWRPGEDMPSAPLLTATDSTKTSGIAGVSVWNMPFINAPVEASFRYVHVADVHIHPGDFDNNGRVDDADLLTWQQGYGLQSGAAPADGDADYDGDVDGRDFLVWQREYGTVAARADSLTQVPEPSTLLFCAVCCGVVLLLATESRRQTGWLVGAGFAAMFFLASAVQADVYQWEYVDPLDPSQGKQQSTTLTPDGEGLVVRAAMKASERDLTQAYLAGVDLSGADLSKATLNDGYLPYANLTKASLYNAALVNADLSGANLRDIYAYGIALSGADLSNAEIRGAVLSSQDSGITAAQLYSTASYQARDLTGLELGYHDVTGWDFAETDLSDMSFLRATVTDADFTGAEVRGAYFYEAIGLTAEQIYATASYQAGDLTGLILYGLELPGWNFAGKNLTDGSFVYATLTDADFSSANLTYGNFISATLTAATFTNTNITDANFSLVSGGTGLTSAQLYSTSSYQAGNLAGIGLAGNNLAGWDLAGQNLTRANLTGANLTGTNLGGATLTDADLSGPATLTGADFTDARITGADFSGSGITSAQLYSTASYQAGDLTGIDLTANDLAGWNFAGQNLTNANLQAISLAGADFTGAWIGGATLGEFTLPQLYSTASYQARDLAGVSSFQLDLTGVDLSRQNLTGADLAHAHLTGANLSGANLTDARLVGVRLTDVDLTGAEIRGADFGVGGPGTGVTAEQIYSTASYRAHDLTGVGLQGNHLTGWDLTGLEIRGANLESTDVTVAQLYSTVSYQAGDLTGVHLGLNDLTGIDFSGVTLTSTDFATTGLSSANLSGANLKGAAFPAASLIDANLRNANLTGTSYWHVLVPTTTDLSGADLTGADARGATDMYTALAETRNFIDPDGRVKGLQIYAGETMRLWDFDLSEVERWWGGSYGEIQIDILVENFLTIDSAATLRTVFEDEQWRSTVAFESGIPVSLAGTLELLIDDEAIPESLVGATFQLFDWTGVTPVGQFDWILTQNGLLWDTTSLYTTGEVTLVSAVPEPSTRLTMCLAMGILLYISNKHCHIVGLPAIQLSLRFQRRLKP